MKPLKTGGILQMLRQFNTEKACRKHLEHVIWKGTPFCPFCSHTKLYKFRDGKTYKCAECKKNFTITKGTIFERSHIPLTKWFYAIHMFASHKKGISSHQLARDIEITQSNAWVMLHKIRHAMNNNKQFKVKLEGVIEIDETYVGGKNKNRHYSKKIFNAQGRSLKDKSVVFGLLQRDGNVITIPIKKLYSKGMRLIIKNKIKSGSTVVTDEFKGYKGLRKYFQHEVVNHAAYQYVNGDYTTNGIEGFWSLLKRGIVGVYHSVSKQYLFRYCDEFEYRYNTRNFTELDRFNTLLAQFFGVRVMRRTLL